MPDFITPPPDEYTGPDSHDEAITEAFGQIDWAITRLTGEVEGLHGLAAAEIQRETTLRIRHLTELNESLRRASR